MKDCIIVSLTTWSQRIGNVPIVLDTIFSQTTPPDLVVLNLAYDEKVPTDVQDYLNYHSVEINRVSDTKVYKKLLPTLRKYPQDIIINIDDDWLYPKSMIADFIKIHQLYPMFPISGNAEVYYGMQCHCGCASLTKAEFFGEWIDMIDQEVIKNCPSDDIVFTFLANKAQHPYVRTEHRYFTNMEPYNASAGYSELTVENNDGIESSFRYLIDRFGAIDNFFEPYLKDAYLARLLSDICSANVNASRRQGAEQGAHIVYSSCSYRLGNLLLAPIAKIKRILLGN